MKCENGFLISNGILSKYVGHDTDVVIPEGVTEIGESAFARCASIVSVAFPTTLKIIGSRGFYECTNLATVSFSPGISKIGNMAFNGTALKEVVLPDSVCELGVGVFMYCEKLSSLRLPRNIRIVDGWVIGDCPKVSELILPDSVTGFAMDAFVRSDGVKYVYGRNVTRIDGEPWEIHTWPRVVLPKISIKDTEHDEFRLFLALGFLSRPELYETALEKQYKKYITKEKMKILQIAFSEDDVSIVDYCCTQRILTPEAVKGIYMDMARSKAAVECLRYFETMLPENEQEADPYSVAVMKDLWKYRKRSDGTYELTKYLGTALDVVIPPRIGDIPVTRLGDSLFERRYSPYNPESDIRSVKICEGVREIGVKAFRGCDKLESVWLPESLETIDMQGFAQCESLERIMIPQGVHTISDMAFRWCTQLQRIVLPEKLRRLGSGAFNGCEQLSDISFPDSLERLEAQVFSECVELQTVTIPERVRIIDEGAFYGCENLEEVHITARDLSIGPYVFSGCPVTIYAPAGSTGESYAKKNKIPFAAE